MNGSIFAAATGLFNFRGINYLHKLEASLGYLLYMCLSVDLPRGFIGCIGFIMTQGIHSINDRITRQLVKS